MALAVACSPALAQKKPLDATAYDIWRSVTAPTLSADGKWMAYGYSPQEGDRVNEVKATDGSKTYTFERGSLFRFSRDSRYLVASVIPKFADSKKARIAKAKPEDMPKNVLLILNLETGQKTEMERITGFTMPQEDSGWIMYTPEPPKPEPAKPATAPAATTPAATTPPGEAKQDDKPKKKSDHAVGRSFVLRELATGKEVKLTDIVTSTFTKKGDKLFLVKSTKDGAGDGVFVLDLASGKETAIVQQMGKYPRIIVKDDGSCLAFITDKDDYAAKKPKQALYVWDGKALREMAKDGGNNVPKDWMLTASGQLSFSESGRKLTFATVPVPPEEKKDETPDEDKVNVDIWNWMDPILQPQQLLQAGAERTRTYDAVLDLGTGKALQLENPDVPNVIQSNKGDGDYGMVNYDKPYRREGSWGVDMSDIYVVDMKSGTRDKMLEKFEGNVGFSPTGKYLFGYSNVARQWFSINPKTRERVAVSAGIPYPVYDEMDDHPDYAPPYGIAGWTKDDAGVLINDRYDIWLCDPTGKNTPRKLTSGRARYRIYREFSIDPEEEYIGDTFYCTIMDDNTKATGIVRVDKGVETTLIHGDKKFNWLGKAKDADKVLFAQMTFMEYPDVWLTNLSFANPKKMTDANPQQKDWNWGTEELVTYRSNDGEELQGLLFKPENFDYGKKYPMIAYFYERDADTLHTYRTPAPSASTINIAMYVSNGYLVFVPDIAYKVGYPGESAISAITAGVNKLIDRGYVDPKKVGIQGQSWGGYQVAYMITESNMFAAACAGAPVANMFSAYGGIRWGSGLVRQFQYEKTQSRIGGTPWNSTMRYFENSPIFYADKVKTPLLIMHNDADGSVPWWQSIEYFTALRRLDKPAWMAVYNGEDHNLIQRKNRKDWSIRMQQFFDHYLKGAPMPKWMSEGVAGVNKGKDYGFELPKSGGG